MLVFDTEIVRAGTIKHGEIYDTRIPVVNTGDTTVTPHAPQSACSCTRGYFEPSDIPPGSVSFLALTFDSKKVGLGGFTKDVMITYNLSGVTKSKTIKLEITVIK